MCQFDKANDFILQTCMQAFTGEEAPSRQSSTNTTFSIGASGSATCGICFDPIEHPSDLITAAVLPPPLLGSTSGASSSSSTAAVQGCGHLYCQGCAAQYMNEQVSRRKYPVLCPHPSCHERFSDQDVQMLLLPASRKVRSCSTRAFAPIVF
jgi:hypothetical protein